MLPLLEVQHLTVSFGPTPVVRDVSFQIFPGRTLCLVGESGSGKSMTAFSIMRLLPSPGRISSGSLLFDGEDLLKLDEKAMRTRRGRDISMIFQEPMTSLNPVLRIGRQLAEPLEIHEGLHGRAAEEKAVELLEMVGIPDPRRRLNDYPHQFSGGMRQRVMIAMAPACSPRLLLAERTHHGSRHHHSGADSASARQACQGTEHGRSAHNPRPRRSSGGRRRRGRHVCRRTHGAGPCIFLSKNRCTPTPGASWPAPRFSAITQAKGFLPFPAWFPCLPNFPKAAASAPAALSLRKSAFRLRRLFAWNRSTACAAGRLPDKNFS